MSVFLFQNSELINRERNELPVPLLMKTDGRRFWKNKERFGVSFRVTSYEGSFLRLFGHFQQPFASVMSRWTMLICSLMFTPVKLTSCWRQRSPFPYLLTIVSPGEVLLIRRVRLSAFRILWQQLHSLRGVSKTTSTFMGQMWATWCDRCFFRSCGVSESGELGCSLLPFISLSILFGSGYTGSLIGLLSPLTLSN